MKYFYQTTHNIFKHARGCLMALFLLMATFNPSDLQATHFRYESIKWQKINGSTNQVRFTISTAWRSSFYGAPAVGSTVSSGYTFFFGDMTSTPMNFTVTSVNTSEDWFYAETVLTHAYASGSADYVAFFENCCRLSTLENSPDDVFRAETTVNIGTSNNSPSTTLPPIISLPTGMNPAKFVIPGADGDSGDTLNFSLTTIDEVGIAPLTNFSVSSKGVASFKTTGLTVGNLYTASVKITDGEAIVFVDFIIKIVKNSNPPNFVYSTTPADGYVYQVSSGDTVCFTVKAEDSDSGSTVKLSGSGIPSGASFSPGSAANPVSTNFCWVPGTSQYGTTVISFTATDNNGNQTITSVTIIVSNKPQFVVPPTPATTDLIVVKPGDSVKFTVKAMDPDPADTVTINNIKGKDNTGMTVDLSDTLYSGATFTPYPTTKGNPTSGTFYWIPKNHSWGFRPVTFTAEDKYGEKTSHTVNILVNTIPEFTSTPVTSVCAGSTYTYNVSGKDADAAYGDKLKLLATTLPSWLTFTDNGDGTGKFTGTPGAGDVGTHDVLVYLEDTYHDENFPAQPFQYFKITVAPVVNANAGKDTTICSGGSAKIGGQPVTGSNYVWSSSPSGFNSTASNAIVSPTFTTTYTLTETGSGGCSKSNAVTVTVKPKPTVTISQSNLPAFCQGGYVLLTATPSETATYAWSNGGTDATNQVNASGTYTVTITTPAGCTGTASKTVTYDAVKMLSSYTLLAKKNIDIEKYSYVKSGGVGVTGTKGEIDVVDNSKITGSGTFAKAYDIDVLKNSTVTNKYEGSPAAVTFPNFISNPYCDCKNSKNNKDDDDDDDDGDDKKDKKSKDGKNNDKDDDDNKGGKDNKKDCPKNLKVKKGSKITLTDSVYGKITIESGARVKFSSKVVYAYSIHTSKNDTIEFAGCTRIALCKGMKLGEANIFNAVQNPVVTYAAGNVDISKGSTLKGVIYSMESIGIKGDNGNRTALTGMFLANSINSTYTDFNSSSNCSSCSFMNNRSNTQAPLADNASELRQEDTYLNVYPNPARGNFNLLVNSSYEGPVNITVYRMNGQVVYQSLKTDFSGLLEMPISLMNESAGIYLIRVEMGAQAYVRRVENLR